MVVRMGDRDLGAIGLMDTPREAARTAIAKLRELGIGRMIMISGDHQKVAESIAAEVGIDEAWGDLMPDQKVDAIRDLKAEQPVAMVGEDRKSTRLNPVTNAHLVCRLLLEKKNKLITITQHT